MSVGDSEENSRINLADRTNVYVPSKPSVTMAAADRLAYEQWFYDADKDRSGYLTHKELKKALKKKGYKLNKKQFKKQFQQFDLDGDGKITFEEYMICMGQVPEVYHKEALIREAFQKADKNGDGVLDIGEVNAIFREMKHHLSPDELFKLLDKMDRDKSGQIEYNEFLQFFLKENGFFE